MTVASVEAKESITSLKLMQDKQHETTALLVNTVYSHYNLFLSLQGNNFLSISHLLSHHRSYIFNYSKVYQLSLQ